MIISKQSILTGKTSKMDLPVTKEQIKAWQQGELIQNVMPHLSIVEREFLISGMSEEEQNRIFNNF
jgi:hypothetical protein